jgi:hypothetical protein
MLQSITQFYGKGLAASDGDIGHVKDFYFNDQRWAVRYVIADTGSWLPGRMVLLSPHAFGDFHEFSDCLLVNLTRQQIEIVPQLRCTSRSRDNTKRNTIVTMVGPPTG